MKMMLILKTHAGQSGTPLDVDFGTRGKDLVLRVTTGLDTPHTFEIVANAEALAAMLDRSDLPVFRDEPSPRDPLDDILGP